MEMLVEVAAAAHCRTMALLRSKILLYKAFGRIRCIESYSVLHPREIVGLHRVHSCPGRPDCAHFRR